MELSKVVDKGDTDKVDVDDMAGIDEATEDQVLDEVDSEEEDQRDQRDLIDEIHKDDDMKEEMIVLVDQKD